MDFCIDDRLFMTKHNGSNMPRGAMKIGYRHEAPGGLPQAKKRRQEVRSQAIEVSQAKRAAKDYILRA